ncbi:MAG: rhomboid family intramembrane serine protease [Solirubrobacterales bacterium]
MDSPPELSVVCKKCGSEVSPYVTECPYCGTRLRKRAPKLERRGDELTALQTRRERRRRKAAMKAPRREPSPYDTARPWVTIGALAVPALAVIVQRAGELSVFDIGAIIGPVGDEFWRFFAAPFVYDDLGYLFAVGIALAIFLPEVERRLGPVPAGLLVLAAGSLGMLFDSAVEDALGEGLPVAAGGNGIALGVIGAWVVMRDADRRQDPTAEYDRVAVAVCAGVILLLPLVEDFASPWAGLGGALVGLGCGLAAALGRGRAPAR